MEEDYCRKAAEKLLSLEKGNVLLTTGFSPEAERGIPSGLHWVAATS